MMSSAQLSHSVEELSQALQRVDVLRKEVIANVSHELRSPLAPYQGICRNGAGYQLE
jgi:Signal transduction histidine kinase